jgi:hypothetical protein
MIDLAAWWANVVKTIRFATAATICSSGKNAGDEERGFEPLTSGRCPVRAEAAGSADVKAPEL